MDPKPLATVLDTMHTYLYAPATPFNEGAADSNPGIPEVNRHLRLSFASFDEFSATNPLGAPGPTLAANPFIGGDPLLLDAGLDDPPGVTVSMGGREATGSFLLDTGAQSSFPSTEYGRKTRCALCRRLTRSGITAIGAVRYFTS